MFHVSSLKPASLRHCEREILHSIRNHLVFFPAVCRFPCQNGGVCQRPNACSCPDGWMGRLCEERESVSECSFAPQPLPRPCWLMGGSGNAFAISQTWLPQILAADPSVQGYSQGPLGCRRSSYSIYDLEFAVASSKASRALLEEGLVTTAGALSLPLPQPSLCYSWKDCSITEHCAFQGTHETTVALGYQRITSNYENRGNWKS